MQITPSTSASAGENCRIVYLLVQMKIIEIKDAVKAKAAPGFCLLLIV